MEARDLRPHLLVAGSGKTGRDCGLYFLARGWRVTWLSRDRERRERLARRIERELRRLEQIDPGQGCAGAAAVFLLDPAIDLCALKPDLFLEAVAEDVALKREVFARVAPQLASETPLATNSSSILPEQIHPACLGAHCFYPLGLTRLVEAVIPPGAQGDGVARLLRLLRGVGLRTIVQTPSQAFAVNRLLLPMQAAALRALRDGWPAALVDGASATPLMPVGQLALMDAVGLDTIAAAAGNYLGRLPPEEAQGCADLPRALRELLAAGKLGRKNRDGLLSGAPLPWPARQRTRDEEQALGRGFAALADATCARAVESGAIGRDDLKLALSSLFGTAVAPPSARGTP